MADYLTNTTDLTKVADAIRAKGKTGASMTYPAGFVAAIEAIKTGTELKIIVSVKAGAVVTATKGSATVSGTSVNGTCTLVVPEAGTWSVAATLDGKTAAPKTVTLEDSQSVALSFLSAVLNDNDWSTIREVSDKGEAANWWSVGDCKAVTLNGTVGHLTLTNYTAYAFILGFDHNSAIEGKNRIHFQIGKTALSGGTDIAFCDDIYGGGASADGYFSYKHATKSSYDWYWCNLRTNICGTSLTSYAGTFIGAFPAELRAVLKAVTKYTGQYDNGGARSETEYCFALSDCEAGLWSQYSGNSTNQEQYAYYSAGNSKTKYNHAATSVLVNWWTRTPRSNSWQTSASVDTGGALTFALKEISYGVAPCFCV